MCLPPPPPFAYPHRHLVTAPPPHRHAGDRHDIGVGLFKGGGFNHSSPSPVKGMEKSADEFQAVSGPLEAPTIQRICTSEEVIESLDPDPADESACIGMSDFGAASVPEAVLMDTRKAKRTTSVRFDDEASILFEDDAGPSPAVPLIPGPFDPPTRDANTPFNTVHTVRAAVRNAMGPFGSFRERSTMGSALYEESESFIYNPSGSVSFSPASLIQRQASYRPMAPKAVAQRHVCVS